MPLTKVKSGGVSDSITLTSPDINAPDIDGGTIDNAVIGGSTAAAGSFTTITATGGSSSNWNTAYGWGDHSTQSYATQTYVGTEVSNLVDSSPAALDTLNELAAALGDDPNFATTVTNSIALKAPLASPSFTGTATMDGLTVNPTASAEISGAVPGNYILKLDNTHATSGNGLRIETPSTSSSEYSLVVKSNNGSNNNLVVSNNGDISFYEDTGTTAKLFWDASAESLGIGTSSVVSALDVLNGGNTYTSGLVLRNGSSTSEATSLYHDNTGSTTTVLANRYGSDSAAIKLVLQDASVSPVTALTALGNGNVGIGCTPASKLDIDISTDARGSFSSGIGEVGSGNFALQVTNSAGSALKPLGFRAEDIRFATGGSERMRISSAGNVGIGVTPSSEFHVKGDANTIARIEPNNNSGKATLLVSSTGSGDGGIQYDANTNNTHLFSYSDMTFNVGTGNLSGGYPANERMRIDSSGRVTMPYQPTWGASSLSNTSASGGTTSAGTLVFSGVLNNNGNHYSNSTGLFTAPVAGQYFVTFSGLYDDSYNVTGAVYIRRNTANLYRGYHQNSGSSYLQISMSGVVECSAGDTISIYSSIAGWHIGGETSFSGFLIG